MMLSKGQREVCARDEKFAFGKIDPTLLREGSEGPRFVTCKCERAASADLYLSIHRTPSSKWQRLVH